MLAFASGMSLIAMAAPAQDAGSASPDARSSSRTATFTQLGIHYPIVLHGVQGDAGIPFSVRSDEVVRSATLHLRYAYSPALIPTLSHINVSVNDVLATTLPTPAADAGRTLDQDIQLDPRTITDFNQLNLRLIGHYTKDCEDPDSSSLWANVSNDSELTLTTTPLVLANELASLPLPFFDTRDVRPLELPFVFVGMPDHAMLQTAGAVSAWFGALAGYRGASFPVSLDALPADNNAIVFALAGTSPGGLVLPPVNGPTLAMVTHPHDPTRKLLLVLGRTEQELRTAAMALTIGKGTLSGATTTIASLQELAPRKPHDAPNWIASDHPVRFGELATERELNVTGYHPDLVRINLQLPPDLFAWRSDGIPIALKYRYTPPQSPDTSRLNIDINDAFVATLPLPAAPAADSLLARWDAHIGADGTLPRHTTLHLPTFLFSSRSQLRFHYYFDRPHGEACKAEPGDDQVHGAIDADSTIDLSGIPHFIAMPDLAAFGNAGFPFTRMADLSDTAIILPDNAGADDASNVLTLMGRMGVSTGYPTLKLSIGDAAHIQQFADKDLIVLGSRASQPLFGQWEASMPMTSDGNTYRFPVSDWTTRGLDWLIGNGQREDLPNVAQISRTIDPGDVIVMGFESPLTKGRSVVAVMANDPTQLNGLFAVISSPTQIKALQGSVALIRAGKVQSLAGNSTYYVGKLPPLTWLRWFLSRHPLLLAVCTIVLGLLGALLLRATLRPIAARRLRKRND